MKTTIPNLVLVIGVLAGSCSQIMPRTPQGDLSPVSAMTLTVPATAFREPTAPASIFTSEVPTSTAPSVGLPTPIVTGTQSSVPADAHLKIQCVEIASSIPPDLASTGVLALHGVVDQGNGQQKAETDLVDMAARTKTQIDKPGQALAHFAVSPDKKWLAYQELIQKVLVISSADGHPVKGIPWRKEWGSLVVWLDDQRLVINAPVVQNNIIQNWPLMTLNPFTGDEHILQPDYPGLFQHPNTVAFDGWGSTVYDPSLSRVVYLQGGAAGVGGPFQFVLWDLQSQRSLASYASTTGHETIPRWESDGERFAIEVSGSNWPAYELYSVTRQGQVVQLTNLTTYYPWVYIDDYSWSPDGRNIAVWFSGWKNDPGLSVQGVRLLAVVDTVNHTTTDYCIPGDYNASEAIRRVPPPLWSPDGKQIVVQNLTSESASRVILIDLKRGVAAQIAVNMTPVGWMSPDK